MKNLVHKIYNPGECSRIHRGLTTTVNFKGINVMAESDSIKNRQEIKFKFCSFCGEFKPNDKNHFHSTNGKNRYECLDCSPKTDPVFCFICGKPMLGKGVVCLSCRRNKNKNGFYLSKQMPVEIIKKIRAYMGNIKDVCETKSRICSKCGFVLPLDEFYYQRARRKDRWNYKSDCKKCRTGKFRALVTPRTKKEWSKIRKKQRRSPVQFDSWVEKLFADDVRKGKSGLLQAKCKYCDRWFYPPLSAVESRYRASIGQLDAENGLYCSSGCKQACPSFNQQWSEKEQKQGTSREANALLRKLVLNRDKHQCTKCGAKGKKIELHCHHVMPATQNPMLANDPDNCITLCRMCHVETHRTVGCGYYELRCGA